MGSTFKVSVKPEVLSFAIKRSCYSIEELVNGINNRFNVKYFNIEYLNGLLKGNITPRYSDLKKIDSFLKRGVPFYLLEELPEEKIFVNFRKKHSEFKLSPQLEIKLRKYEYLREENKVLLEDENISYDRILRIYDTKEDPIKIALGFRKQFGLDEIDIEQFKSKDIFEYIRRKIENHIIFVFKDSLDILRGCLFLDEILPPLILINSNDDKNADIFSLVHEFAHYLLNNEGIDIDDIDVEDDQEVEFWCNSFAYHFMMIEEYEIKEGFFRETKDILFTSDRLRLLSNKYKLSRHAFVYRFYRLKIINLGEYYEFLSRVPYKQKAEKSKGGNYYYTNRDRLSRKFISLVYENYLDGNVSLHETYNYLGVRDNYRLNQLLDVFDNE